MGIPRLLLERGHKVITLSHLPAHDLDLSEDYPQSVLALWQHILSGAKLVAHHPNLYAVYLTNHGCGPDTMLSICFGRRWGTSPICRSKWTSISLRGRDHTDRGVPPEPGGPPCPAASGGLFLAAVVRRPYCGGCRAGENRRPLLVPDLPPFTAYLRAYCEAAWKTETRTLRLDSTTLPLGRAETSSKEYLPFPALLGGILTAAGRESGPFQVLLPSTQGAEADGQYPWGVESVLERRGLCRVKVIAPELETIPERCPEPDLLVRRSSPAISCCALRRNSGTHWLRRCAELGGAGSPRGAHRRHSGGGTAAGDRGRAVHPLQPS